MTPFIAVTAHWIETKIQKTPTGEQYILQLRSELIGFHRLPGRHDGEHISVGFMWIIDRLKIAHLVCRFYRGLTLSNLVSNSSDM